MQVDAEPREEQNRPGRKRWTTWTLALLLVCGAGSVLLVRGGSAKGAADASARDVPRLEDGRIRFSPEFASQAKLEIARPEIAALSPTLDVTGTVTFDAARVAAVGSRIAGRVRSVAKIEGDDVKKGDLLAEIESAELGQAQAAVIAARAHSLAAEANDARTKGLAEVHAASVRDAEQAAAQAASAKADLHAAEQRVRAFGGEPNGEPGVLRLVSPIAGRVVERHVSRGQSVEPTLTTFIVADLSHLWVELAIFERDLELVRAGDDVRIAPQTAPGASVRGKVAHVGDVLDRETRSAKVRIVIDNAGSMLRPGQSVLAHLQSTGRAGAQIVVPRDAVLMVDGKPTLFISHDATSVVPRGVELGATDGDRVAIVSGLAADESFVRTNAFALKSELFR